ncbi:protein SODIUM POTASSIUM ROOT DEFECTIVE 1-like [Ricinus communis]|uniref:protein SODIUM POTASSIUM ROOT DEFECTIVE 1-like n=1 Tax=Ricinus communis TaxID=3988 RepID=UPI00201A74F4|nr:protein SODIUM POTASSIUM ROOT DEFECTIVE 1-like [Ricinus communis]
MAMKASKKMKGGGFMCHSTAATAVCTVSGPRSAIVPRRPNRTTMVIEHSRLKKTTASAAAAAITPKYSRLLESPLILPAAITNRPSSVEKEESNYKQQIHRPIPLQKPSPLLASSSSSPLPSSDQVFQVVVMRVALHCQGCAGKVKKHLSKMEGVTSFSIDLEAKRVTVMGHVSPVKVLESISKVKRAEFWPCS